MVNHKKYMRLYYKQHIEEINYKNNEWRHNHRKEINAWMKEYVHDNKYEVMNHYGGYCVCCGEIEIAFLTIDHVNGGGRKHRSKIGRGYTFYLWLINNNFPYGFQVLCFNCQQLKQLKLNKIKWEQNKGAIKQRKCRHKFRFEVISHYGGRCTCCGETNIDLLTIDHICGGGCEHRRKIGVGSGGLFYQWLRKNDFPPGYQVLCWNCNCGRSVNGGVCPHQKLKVK